MTAYMKREYTSRWLDEFCGQRKKTVWSRITREGEEYPSLSTFYHWIRTSGIDDVLREYLAYRKLSVVVRILSLRDTYLDEGAAEVSDLELAIDSLKREIIR
ncbi:MAG: hypothetical protein KGM83_10410 [Betaproteobacteria bacterium]|nr:hypothetical protein [Betaproteobacteria bacterium]